MSATQQQQALLGAQPDGQPDHVRPWAALAAVCLGFFMIMVDSTIVPVATPTLMTELGASVNAIVWVTSAYLLAYAVPLLFTGRLGDQFGPRRVYLAGLIVFTVASAACGFAGSSVTALIGARVVQGVGAALLTPQAMAVIARVFPPERRGAAMGIWGSVAGIALLLGPILGGALTDAWGWPWIFFINIPIGVASFVLARFYVPRFVGRAHRFDLPGIALSATGLAALVYGVQQGESRGWDTLTWVMIVAGCLGILAFFWSQRRPADELLVPLAIFRDRNVLLAGLAVTGVGFAATAIALPLMLYAQQIKGLTPTRAALLMLPMALIAAALAPVVGRLVDRSHPARVAGTGVGLFAISVAWLGLLLSASTPIWQLLLPIALMGVANACTWAPISATATRNLPQEHLGAGSGVFNTARQVGGVLGSAGVGALMQARLQSDVAGRPNSQRAEAFSTAMGQSLLLPAFVLVLALVAVALFVRPEHAVPSARMPEQDR